MVLPIRTKEYLIYIYILDCCWASVIFEANLEYSTSASMQSLQENSDGGFQSWLLLDQMSVVSKAFCLMEIGLMEFRSPWPIINLIQFCRQWLSVSPPVWLGLEFCWQMSHLPHSGIDRGPKGPNGMTGNQHKIARWKQNQWFIHTDGYICAHLV